MGKLAGHELNSKKIQELIHQLVQEVSQLSAKLPDQVRDPMASESEHSKDLIDRIGKFRGRPLQYPYVGTGIGKGVYVELEDGSIKMDLINGIGVHIQGHSHPEVIRASIEAALTDVVNHGNLQMNKEYLLLGEKLIEFAHGSRLKHAWLSTCGTIANENALKMARQKKSPAKLVITPQYAFAGRSTMMAEITDNTAYKQGLPEYHEVLRIPFCDHKQPDGGKANSLARLKEIVAQNENNISVFCFEPILGEGGYRIPQKDFYKPLLDFCREKKIAIWADEVQTFLRTGQPFAFQTMGFGDYVDICTVAKTAQVGATLFTEEYNPKPGLVAGTFAGTAQALNAGLAILNTLESGNFFGPEGRIQQIHNQFMAGLKTIQQGSCKGLISEIEGIGLMLAFTPMDGGKETVSQFLNTLFKNGIITLSCGRDPYRARFLIPMVIKDQQIQEALKIIEKTLIECGKGQ